MKLIIITIIILTNSYTDPTLCTTNTQFYDPVLLQCTTCPTNTARATDFTYCNCSNSFYWNPDTIGFNFATSCKTLGQTYNSATQVVSLYNVDGSLNPTITTCNSAAYPDPVNGICIPCGPGMTYSATLSACQCSGGQYALNGQCYTSTGFTSFYQTTDAQNYKAQIHARIGCGQYGLIQSCNILVNRCVFNNYSSSNFFCQYLANLTLTSNTSKGLPTYTFSSSIATSINIYASSIPGTNTSTIKNTLNFILVQYNIDGSINDIKPLDNSIFSCYLAAQDIVDLQSMSGVINKFCKAYPRTFPIQYFYDVYVQNADGTYAQVPLYFSGSYYKRFTPKYFSSIEIYIKTVPPLQVPLIILRDKQGLAKTYLASSNPIINYFPFFVIFLVVTIVIFILHFYRYLKYNPDEQNNPYYCFKVIFLFLVYILKYIGMGIFLWLLCFSTFLFCFYKFQQTIYLIIVDQFNETTGLYQTFNALFYVNFSLTLSAILIFIFNLVNTTDYFLIDWQKQKQLGKFEMGKNKKQVSIWRKVLLVNQLYELSVHRIINIQTISLFSLIFLQGLKWINLRQLVPNISYNLQNQNGYYISSLLAYFIITFVIFATAIVQYLIRFSLKIWWPLPIQDFIDLCSVSNISLIIFDEALHGYYIHGMNPLGQSEGSLAYIQSMFEKQSKAFGKSRSFKLDDVDQCQTFEVVFPFEIRQAFQVKYKSRFNQKLAGKSYNTSIMSNPIPQMLNEDDYKDLEQITNSMLQSFKYYLQGVKTSMLNVRQRSFIEKIINCPIDIQTMGKLPVFFKDYWYEFSNVLLSGHQFLLLFNYINFVNIFFIATANIYYAFFIAFIFEKIFSLAFGILIKRNISKNTLIDDKFFN